MKKKVSIEVGEAEVVDTKCLPSLLRDFFSKKHDAKVRALSCGEEMRRRTSSSPEMCHARSEGSTVRPPRSILRKAGSSSGEVGSGGGRGGLPRKERSVSRVRFAATVSIADIRWATLKDSPRHQVKKDSPDVDILDLETNLSTDLEYPAPMDDVSVDKVIRCSNEWCDDNSDSEWSDADSDGPECNGPQRKFTLNRPRSRSYKDLEDLVNICPIAAAMQGPHARPPRSGL